jgi:glycerol-3-phosphate O-acyltransferase
MDPLRILMKFSWFFKTFMGFLVRPRVMTNDLESHLQLDPSKPVCYVLQNRSFADLLVLESLVEKHKLPEFQPKVSELIDSQKASFICLARPGILGTKKVKVEEKLTRIVTHVNSVPKDVQLIPVSIFWGRNPGKENSGFFRNLLFDPRKGGVWQKFLAIVVNGRQTVCNFGQPVSVSEVLKEGGGEEQVAKKIYRVIRVHFVRQTIAVLGPELYNRDLVINNVVRSASVKAAINDLMEKKGYSRDKAEQMAIKCADEIASDLSYKTIYVFEKLLKWLWQKVYSGVELRNEHYLEQIKDGDSIVYMPTHKSHMDYLLVCYVLYFHGMMSPHTAAGINLNFWPVGSFLRRAGAFFLRRSFKGDRLYAACFNEYLYYLIKKGFPINFFPEGGRSRSGRLLKPKTGMLSMVMQAQSRTSEQNITLVPVYISYDKIAEGKSYEKERKGQKKRGESVGQLVKARKLLKTKMGRAYVSFGEPMKLRDYFEANIPEWTEETELLERPKWIPSNVNNLAVNMMSRTNASVIISPVSVVSLTMLSAPNRALTKENFNGVREIYYDWLKNFKYDKNTVVENVHMEDSLEQSKELIGVEILGHPLGDIIHVSENKTMRLSYYSNTILHLFVFPSMISYLFTKRHRRDLGSIVKLSKIFYPFFRREFFLKWDESELDSVVEKTLEFMVKNGMLDPKDGEYEAPALAEVNYTYLQTTAGMLQHLFQYYASAMLLLIEGSKVGEVNRDNYDKQLNYLVDRMSLLSGDSLAFRTISDFKLEFALEMRNLGHSILKEDGTLQISDELKSLESVLETVLDKGVRASIKKIAQLLKPTPDQVD